MLDASGLSRAGEIVPSDPPHPAFLNGSAAEEMLAQATAAFVRAADVLTDHWDDLLPDTRDELLAALESTATQMRRVLALDNSGKHSATLDEILAVRLSCL